MDNKPDQYDGSNFLSDFLEIYNKMKDEEGMSQADIAKTIGIPLSVLRHMIGKALDEARS